VRHTAPSFATAIALTLLALAPANATAAAPTISATTVSEVTFTSATLKAKVNPGNKVNTRYHFEYGTEDCALTPCSSTPQVTLEKGEADVPVEAAIEGLEVGTTYHFRVAAKNGDGESESPDLTFTTQLQPQIFGPCPNDALRTGKPSAKLPGCRGYEQASPVNKNGVDIGGQGPFLKASPTGDAISFMSLSGLPGGDGGQELPLYLARRDPFGWSTQGLLPPAGFGEEVFYRGWIPDFSQAFSTADNLSDQSNGTLISRSADGSHTTILPYGSGLTGANYVGASADGSKVLFESKGKLPGTEAIEGKPNIYLWDRESDEVKLAGVFNDGSVPEQGASAGSLDSAYTQDTHAVSTDGSVFFTDGKTSQLYLRRNPAEEQSVIVLNGNEEECTEPAKACTIHLSATRKENGEGLNGSDAAGTRAARFETATPDGSKLFFTSPEKLTNDANTGPEADHSPAIARAGIGGTGTQLEFLPVHAEALAVQGEYLYWTDPGEGGPGEGTIGRARLNGSGPATEEKPDFITGAYNPQGVAVDAEHIYWTNAESEQPLSGAIGRADIDVDPASVDQAFIQAYLAENTNYPPGDGPYNPNAIAVDAFHICWGDVGPPGGGAFGQGEALMCSDLDGNSPEPVGKHVNEMETLFWEPEPYGLVLDGNDAYYEVDNGIGLQPIDDQFKTSVIFSTFPDPDELRGLALLGSDLFFGSSEQDSMGTVKLDGSGAELQFISGAGHPQGVAVDSEHIYWSANQTIQPNPGNDLYRYDVKSGDLTDIAVDTDDENGADVQGVLGISDDGSYVYFAANGDLDREAGPATPGDCQWSVGNDLDSSGRCSLYLAHGDAIEFIAPLDASGGSSGGSDALNWLPRGVGGQLHKTSRVAPDGQTLIFSSKRRLTSYENEGKTELYRYRVGEPGLHCITCNPTGEPPRGKGWTLGNINFPALNPSVQPASVLSRNLSVDGNRVFFESTEVLVSTDLNGVPANPGEDGCPFSTIDDTNHFRYPICKDVYEWEAQGTGSCTAAQAHDGGCLYLLSSGTSDQPSFFLDASTDGSNAFLITRSPLVGQDGDQLYDVYDARVGGGLKSQNESPHVPCESEGCKPGPSAPPQNQSAGTASFAGPASPKPSLHRKAKKAKKRAHKKQRHRRRANHDRKAGR
jgi:WD40-like Beta Propeller Repeat